jgi:hypothetical protein
MRSLGRPINDALWINKKRGILRILKDQTRRSLIDRSTIRRTSRWSRRSTSGSATLAANLLGCTL